METATVREFGPRDGVAQGEGTILITRRGRIVGFFLPATGTAVPLEMKKDILHAHDSLPELIKAHGLTERRCWRV